MTELYIKTDVSVNPFGIKVNSFPQVHRLYKKFTVIKSCMILNDTCVEKNFQVSNKNRHGSSVTMSSSQP